MTKNLVFHGRTEYIEMQHYFIQELVQVREIELTYYSTKDQVANIFTKALGKIKFHKFKDKLGVLYIGHYKGEYWGNAQLASAREYLRPLNATLSLLRSP